MYQNVTYEQSHCTASVKNLLVIKKVPNGKTFRDEATIVNRYPKGWKYFITF